MHFIRLDSGHARHALAVTAAFVALEVAAVPLSAATTVDLVPVRDNTLYEDPLGGLSNAAGDHCFAGMTGGSSTRRAVFAFDLSSIPFGSIVLSAELRLKMDRAAGFTGPQPCTLHRMTASWGEGTSIVTDPFSGGGAGVAATTNDATWLHRFYASVPWTQPGGDFDPTVLASTLVPETAAVYQWGSTPEMVAVVQGWVNTPASNFGWLLQGNEAAVPSARRFFTREAANAADRPHLIVTYTALSASEPPSVQALRLDPAVPNPFNPSTTLRWNSPAAGLVRITVCDVHGAVVAHVFEGLRPAGPQALAWQARDASGRTLPSGVYVVRLEQGGVSRSQRIVMVR